MIPEQRLSTSAQQADFLPPNDRATVRTVDYDLGGTALNDPSGGLQVQTWRCFVEGDEIMIGPEGGDYEVLFTAPGTTEVALAFDSNMRPAVAFTQDGTPKLRWFDTLAGQQVIDEFPGVDSIRLTLDDPRETQEQTRDIIMTYTKDGNLYFRAQRDRFTVEYLLAENVEGRVRRFGVNRALRMQWELVKNVFEQTIKVGANNGVSVPAGPSFSVPEAGIDTVSVPGSAVTVPANPTIEVP